MSQSLSSIVKSVQTSIKRHSPEILTGIGIAGMITTTVLAVRATPKALELIEEEKLFKEKEAHEGGIFTKEDEQYAFSLTPMETVKAAWKCYIPSAVVAVMSITCLIGASGVNLRRNAALATAYTLSETALKEYQEKVIETIGEKKERSVRDEIAKDKIEKAPLSTNQVIITGSGDMLCFDTLSRRYFKSNVDKIKKVEQELNRQMRDDVFISVNEYFSALGLEEWPDVGYDIGWNIDRDYIELGFSSHLAEDNTPCLAIDYRTLPKYNY